MRILVSEKLSPHKMKTPEGYLICTDAILSRTGKQTYRRSEIWGDACDNAEGEVEVDRKAEEVFNDKTLASFENKPICIEHPDEDVNVSNHNQLSVGFVRDIKRGKVDGQDVMLGTLVITDADAIEAIERGDYTELSCGYNCDIVDEDNPQQRNIRGNHVALCERGRAGIARIIDSIDDTDERQHIGDAAVITSGEHNDVGRDFYGYLSVDHPKLGHFYVSFKIKGRRKEVQLDGTGWNFIKSKGYTAEQKQWIAQHKSDLERISGMGTVADSKMKDIQATKTPGTDKIIYVMQSDVDKNLYFYIGKTFSMKEGTWGYTKFEMGNDTPEKIKAELARNGWHQVASGPAKIIDASNEEWTVVEEENYEKANDALMKDNDADVDKLQRLIAETLSARADAWRNDKQKELNQAKENIANAIDANQKIRSDIKSFYELPEYVRQIAERKARFALKRYDELLNIQHKIYENYTSLMNEANSLAKMIEAKYHVKLNLELHRSGGEREATRILKTIRKQSDSLKDAECYFMPNDTVTVVDATRQTIIEKLRSISIPYGERWQLIDGAGWTIDVQHHGLARHEAIELANPNKNRHVSSKEYSLATIRIWYNSKMLKKIEGPLNVAKAEAIRFLQGQTNDSVEKVFSVSYTKDGVTYINKVRANSITDAVSKVKDDVSNIKDVYNKFEHETDKEYLKSSINEMSRYISNWSFMSTREKRNISPEGLSALKQMLKFAQQRLAELK